MIFLLHLLVIATTVIETGSSVIDLAPLVPLYMTFFVLLYETCETLFDSLDLFIINNQNLPRRGKQKRVKKWCLISLDAGACL